MRRADWSALAVILAVAMLFRLVPILCQEPNGRDQTEYLSIARHLAAGEGYWLDIKAYFVGDSPVQQYGALIRPPLLPILLSLALRIMPETEAIRSLPPLMYLLALILVYDMMRRRLGTQAALVTGLLLAVQPSFYLLSTELLSEPLGLACTALILWGFFGINSAVTTGMGCSLAFLARPSLETYALILGLVYLARIRRLRSAKAVRDLAFFCLSGLAGPLIMLLLNLQYGAPPFQLPQNFLFRTLNYRDVMTYPQTRPLAASAWALIAAQPELVAKGILRNGVGYFKELVSMQWLGMLVMLTPVSLWGVWRSRHLRPMLLLFMMGLADLGLYIVTWSTFDGYRFISQFAFLAVIGMSFGGFAILDHQVISNEGSRKRSVVARMLAMVIVVWGLWTADMASKTAAQWVIDRPLRYNQELWRAPGVDEALRRIDDWNRQRPEGAADQVIASNEPWLIHSRGGWPSLLIPYDLHGEQWIAFMDRYQVGLVVLLDMPEVMPPSSPLAQDLAETLNRRGWVLDSQWKKVKLWRRAAGAPLAPVQAKVAFKG